MKGGEEMKKRKFAVVCAVAFAMCATAQENAPESRTNSASSIASNDSAIILQEIRRASTNAIAAAEETRLANSNLWSEATRMIKTGMLGICNRVDEVIASESSRKPEFSQIKESVRVMVVTNDVATIKPELVEDAVKKVDARLERVESAVAGVSKHFDDDARFPEKKDDAPKTKDWASNSAVVLLGIAVIVLLAVLALVVMIKTAVARQTGELSEGMALLLDKLPGAVGENMRSRFEDMAQARSRADDQFNNLANALGDLKEMVRDGLRPRDPEERRHVPPVMGSGVSVSSQEEEKRLRMRVHELEVRMRARDEEISGMEAREKAAAQKIQDEAKVAQENEARMKKELDLVNGRLAEATARLERQTMPGRPFMDAEAFRKTKADMEEWRGAYPDEVAVIESALSLVHHRNVLSKGTWSSALRDIAATVSGVLEKRGAPPGVVRETLNDWSKALDRIAQSSPGGIFALSVPQIGDQVDSSWMTTVGGASPSRVGAVRTWAVYIDSKIQCYAEVK